MDRLLARSGLEMLKVSRLWKPISANYIAIWVEERYPRSYALMQPLFKGTNFHLSDRSIPLVKVPQLELPHPNPPLSKGRG